jgi:surface polysaccharide O-acyltransferase-like enzyme
MKKPKKSTLVTLALLIYITATALYFLPRNSELTPGAKYISVGVAYALVLILWLVNRWKENMQQKRKEKGL